MKCDDFEPLLFERVVNLEVLSCFDDGVVEGARAIREKHPPVFPSTVDG